MSNVPARHAGANLSPRSETGEGGGGGGGGWGGGGGGGVFILLSPTRGLAKIAETLSEQGYRATDQAAALDLHLCLLRPRLRRT